MGLESSPQVQQSLISVALQSLTTAVISALLSLPPSPRTAGIFSCNSNQHTGHQTHHRYCCKGTPRQERSNPLRKPLTWVYQAKGYTFFLHFSRVTGTALF